MEQSLDDGRTVFLARLIGLYCVVMALAMLVRPEQFALVATELVRNGALLLVAGVFTLFLGLAMVLAHNRWHGGALTVAVTVIGWLSAIKGAAMVVLPPAAMAAIRGPVVAAPVLWGLVTLVLGLALCWGGFRARDVAKG